ncbi:MAG TPA: GNAT family protein [Solirubrobacteraceae bacterium]|nr:GNAT family protein [Solirubrobacteraceae bacterium]
MPAIPPLKEPLSDGHVTLRMAAERDIPEILIAYQDDPQLHIRLGEDRPPSGANLGTRSERAEGERRAGVRATLTILEPGSDDCRGQLIVHKFDWDNARADVGIWLVPQVRGRGFARRALTLAARWLFDDVGMRRLAILTEPDNQPMLHAARAAGFVDEGLLRSYGIERGRRVDLAVLSLLPEDLRR